MGTQQEKKEKENVDPCRLIGINLKMSRFACYQVAMSKFAVNLPQL